MPADPQFRAGSLLTSTNLFLALIGSAIYHLFLNLIVPDTLPLALPEFWMFLASDIAIWTLALIPLIAIARRHLAWYDPLALLSLMFFSMTCLFSLAYWLDPPFVRFFSSYDGFIFQDSTEANFLWRVVQAQVLHGVFWSIVLWTNRRRLVWTVPPTNPPNPQRAIWTGALCIGLSLVGLFNYWTLGSFIGTLTGRLGLVDALPAAGRSWPLILVNIGVAALSLGLVGVLRLLSASKHRWLIDLAVPIAGVVAIVPNLWNAARADALFALITVFVVSGQFGIRLRKSTWLLVLVIGALLFVTMTVLRGNPELPQDPGEVIDQLFSGQLGRDFLRRPGASAGTLLAADRVSVMAMAFEYQKHPSNGFFYGESLAAGPVNMVVYWLSRLGGIDPGSLIDPLLGVRNNMLLAATERLNLWRYGWLVFGAVPPSIPGEFYLQFGVPSLVLLSLLYGMLFARVRKGLARTRSLIVRWIGIATLITLVKLTAADTSQFYGLVLYVVVPVGVVYMVVSTVVKPRCALKPVHQILVFPRNTA